MDWTTPTLIVMEQVAAGVAGLGVVAGAGYAAAAMRHRPALARFAPAVEMAGAIAYDALAAATRRPGVPDYAAARDTALQEGEAALRSLAPGLPTGQIPVIARAALGAKLAQDPAFDLTGGGTAAHAELGREAVASGAREAVASGADASITSPDAKKF